MAKDFPSDERWTLKMWSADWVVLYDWLVNVDFSTIPVEHKSAKQALTDLLNNMDFNLSGGVASVSSEKVELARIAVSKDMDWE